MTSTIGPIPTLQERSSERFTVLLRSFLACDAVMLLFLTFGYVHPNQALAVESSQRDSAPDVLKASPFRGPIRERGSNGRQPDVVHTRGQVPPMVRVSAPPANPVPVVESPMTPLTTAIALPLGIS